MKRSLLQKVFFALVLSITAGLLYAQTPPPPPPGHGLPGDQQPAPVGNGLAIMAVLGAGYAVYMWQRSRKKKG